MHDVDVFYNWWLWAVYPRRLHMFQPKRVLDSFLNLTWPPLSRFSLTTTIWYDLWHLKSTFNRQAYRQILITFDEAKVVCKNRSNWGSIVSVYFHRRKFKILTRNFYYFTEINPFEDRKSIYDLKYRVDVTSRCILYEEMTNLHPILNVDSFKKYVSYNF